MRYNRPLTIEQQIRRDARRAHFKSIVGHLKEMTESDRARLSGTTITNPEGHVLSPINTVLINLQRPGCSVVAGYNQWKKYNYHVRKGESGISIWIPLNAPKTEDDPNPDEIHFSTTTVFDIEQTEEIQESAPMNNHEGPSLLPQEQIVKSHSLE